MRFSARTIAAFGSCLIALMLASPAIAQNRTIKGRVTDEKNQPIAEASIVIQAIDSKTNSYSTKTNKKGEFIHIGIAAGDYYVIARAPNFAPNYAAVRPSLSQESVVNLVLAPGSPNQKLPIEMTAQDIEQAKREAELAQKKEQISAEIQSLFDAGRALAKQGKHLEAIEEYKKALETDPKQTNVMAYMADSYSQLNKNAEALELYQKAIALQPNNAAFYTNMGGLLSKMGKNAESLEAFKKAKELNPAASAQSSYNMGAAMYNSGNLKEAAEEFRKAIAADANFAEAYYQLGMCLSGEAETGAEAIQAFQKYVQIGKKPEQVDVARQMIVTLQESMKKK
jgi:tetratricopeptide (TPR) repeat protein